MIDFAQSLGSSGECRLNSVEYRARIAVKTRTFGEITQRGGIKLQ